MTELNKVRIGSLSHELQEWLVESLAPHWQTMASRLEFNYSDVQARAPAGTGMHLARTLVEMCKDVEIGAMLGAYTRSQNMSGAHQFSLNLEKALHEGTLFNKKHRVTLKPPTTSNNDAIAVDVEKGATVSEERRVTGAFPTNEETLRKCHLLEKENFTLRQQLGEAQADIARLQYQIQECFETRDVKTILPTPPSVPHPAVSMPTTKPAAVAVPAPAAPASAPVKKITATSNVNVPPTVLLGATDPRFRMSLATIISPNFKQIAKTVVTGRDLVNKCIMELPAGHTPHDLGMKLVDTLYGLNYPVLNVFQAILAVDPTCESSLHKLWIERGF